ncbi:hypothetical protein T10_13177 [Trichinella papuae]|uniref:Uncharacterized protein n=1 Tax=Trichinella papuae TaxID=268474 RepID=A0A0V1MCB1_9BILA|nr:hypothetical protein T10_13177 [Trichinella papuae]
MFRTDPTLSLVGDRRRIRFHDDFVSIGRTNESRFLHFAVPNTNPNQEGQGLCCRRTSGKQAARFIHPSKLHFNQQQQQQHYRSMMAHICTNKTKLFILSTLQILQKLNVMLNRCPDFVCRRLRHRCLDPSSSEHLMTEQTNQSITHNRRQFISRVPGKQSINQHAALYPHITTCKRAAFDHVEEKLPSRLIISLLQENNEKKEHQPMLKYHPLHFFLIKGLLKKLLEEKQDINLADNVCLFSNEKKPTNHAFFCVSSFSLLCVVSYESNALTSASIYVHMLKRRQLGLEYVFNYYKLGRKSSQPNTSMLDYITLSQTVADLV